MHSTIFFKVHYEFSVSSRLPLNKQAVESKFTPYSALCEKGRGVFSVQLVEKKKTSLTESLYTNILTS